ncbi:MAG TPA: hypothetical protein PKD91_10910, partial [Bacteroidia bacterium]|nr:hypothetical protein [Bacteroidia bacterium]
MKTTKILRFLICISVWMHGSHVALSQADSSSYNRTFFSPFTLFPGQTADLNTITNDSILKLS